MRGFLLMLALAGAPESIVTHETADNIYNDFIDSVIVSSSRAGKDTPVASVTIHREELRAISASQSLPQSLETQASVIATTEGGSSIGYTNIRIRGVGGYHTNVTLNGITLNDSESEEVFWVNIPALNRILSSIQIQRGLGTSIAGPGAFGASISMSTALSETAAAEAEFSGGSFSTFAGSVHAASGTMKGGFSLEGAYNYLHSDGYIRDAPSNVQSIYACAGWKDATNSLKFTFLQGIQNTGITWEGVPFDIFPTDPRYNSTPGCTDNFSQAHFQLCYSHMFDSGLISTTTANFTDGYGYYCYPSSIDATDNNLYVLRSELVWSSGGITLNGGIYASIYDCIHSGEYEGVQWHRSWSVKKEADIWARAEWRPLNSLTIYGEAQLRVLQHRMTGSDEYGESIDYVRPLNFFNPRAGISWKFAKCHQLFFSTALGHREAARADILVNREVNPEKLIDFELGYRIELEKFHGALTLYSMEYFDMLLETGLLNPSGYAIKTNMPRGWRRGIELEAMWSPLKKLTLGANATLSDNRYSTTAILLSPPLLASANAKWEAWKGGTLTASCQYVGEQYWDNSGQQDRVVPQYFTLDLSLSQKIKLKAHMLTLSGEARNILDRNYYAYAYAGGVYPAAPFNFSLSARFEL